jgi:DNA-binding NtrC family response regulator
MEDPRTEAETSSARGAPAERTAEDELPLKEACEQFEREYVLRAVHRQGWNLSGAARALGVHRNTILRKLDAWGLQRPSDEEEASS